MKTWLTGLPISRIAWVPVALLVVLVAVTGAGKLTIPFWDWLRSGGDGPIESIESNGTSLRNLALLLAGVITLPLALWRSWVAERQTRISQQGLLEDMYQRGFEMLYNPLQSARVGGIHTLQRLAQKHSKQYHILVMERFCDFARNPTPDTIIELEPTHRDIPSSDNVERNDHSPRLREDVQAALKVIGYRSKEMRALEKRDGFRVDLSGADLRGANLDGANLSGANLAEVKLSRARLIRANLSGAVMWHADLSCSSEVETNKTFLDGAKLDDVNLMYANLSGSRLQGARLHRAILFEADMSNTFLYQTHLIEADLSLTDLSEAVLKQANISGARLHRGHTLGIWLTAEDENPTTRLTQ